MLSRRASGYGRSFDGLRGEHAGTRAAALLAAITDPVPPVHADRPAAHAGRLAWRALALVALAVLAYLPALANPDLLDGEADALHHLAPPTLSWADLFHQPSAQVDSPWLLRVLLQAENEVGYGALTHHGVGLILHAAVVVLLWLTLRRLTRPGAWLAAAAFAVDPGSTAAVEWAGQRGRLWGAALAVGGALLLLRAAGVPSVAPAEDESYGLAEAPTGLRRWVLIAVRPLLYAVTLLLLGGAALCQPTIAPVGLVALLLVGWRRGLRWRDGLLLAPLLALALLAATESAGFAPGPTLPLAGRLLWETGRALERVAWPLAWADLAGAGPRSQVRETCGLGVAVWVAVPVLFALRRRIGSGPAVAAGCFLLLLPTLRVPPALPAVPGLPPADQTDASATYLLAIPVLVVLADSVVLAARRMRGELAQRLAEVAAAAAALAGLGWLTVVRAAAFDNTESVLKTAVAVNRGAWPARTRLAGWYLHQGRPDPAADTLAGLTPANCPDAATAMVQGDLLQYDGDAAAALAWYQRARSLDPGDVTAVSRQSGAYLRLDRVGDAIDTYEQAIGRHPDDAGLRDDFGQLLMGRGDSSVAAEQFRQALRADPDRVSAHVNLATALLALGQASEAATQLQEAVRLDPENFGAFHNAGVVLWRYGDYPGAIHMLTEAVRLRGDSAEYRNDLAVALIAAGQYKPAEFELAEAIRLRPDYADARGNLEVLHRRAAIQQQRANVEGN